jgi:sugar (pentulose or hexulose) kinase
MRLFLALLSIYGDSEDANAARQRLWRESSPMEREVARGQLEALASSLQGMLSRVQIQAERVEKILGAERLMYLQPAEANSISQEALLDANEARTRGGGIRNRVLKGIMADPTIKPSNRSHTGMAAAAGAEGHANLLETLQSFGEFDDLVSTLLRLDAEVNEGLSKLGTK